ncbi:hypothetical protein CXY01_29010 [Cellulomonas xylanilytica]|uniref:Uncharacterized protein n=1 Tax=Cellulomonas xylanilytica TaxID=233583 RepID=A0A510V8T8_9CELL|nr:hypothetical protein CXY01_29010 [Cellulomonas xylanilytica]
MTATADLVSLTEQVAVRLTASGLRAHCDVVEGDPYVRVDLTHDGTAAAWVPLDDPTWALVRDQAGMPCRVEPAGPLAKGWEACSDVECLTMALWEWVLRRRAGRVRPYQPPTQLNRDPDCPPTMKFAFSAAPTPFWMS